MSANGPSPPASATGHPPHLADVLAMLKCRDLSAIQPRSRWQRLGLQGLPPEAVVLPVPTPAIERIIDTLPFGGWRIRRDTARALALLFATLRPKRVLEFGCGSSTVLLAALCSVYGGARVVALEERWRAAERTRALLWKFGFNTHVRIIPAPVAIDTIVGWEGWMYRPDRFELEAALDGQAADLLFIDGPANWRGVRDDCRFGTIPQARAWIGETAVFAADDALRPRDLDIVQRWQHLVFVDVHGIVPTARGLAIGTLHGEAGGSCR